MALGIGDTIDGRYELTQLLGEGGMGTVYRARRHDIHRDFAIKMLHAVFAADATMVKRFEREAQAAGRIGSDHIVEVFDAGSLPSGEHYMVMEFVDGETLAARLKRVGRMSPEEIFPLTMQLLTGLAAAHKAGIVHRDLKPANVLVTDDRRHGGDFIKILDFGVSKFLDLDSDGVTKTGMMIGTPHFMAPEQTKGARHADHRSDIYAVGVILYRALCGRMPYKFSSVPEFIAKLVTEDPPSIETLVDIDVGVADIIRKSMERDPERRFADAQAFSDALGRWLRGSPALLDDLDLPTQPSHPGARPSSSGAIPAVDPRQAPTLRRARDDSDPASLATPSPSIYEAARQAQLRKRKVGAVAAVFLALPFAILGLFALAGPKQSDVPSSAPQDRAVAAAAGAASSASTPIEAPSSESSEPAPSAATSASVTADKKAPRATARRLTRRTIKAPAAKTPEPKAATPPPPAKLPAKDKDPSSFKRSYRTDL